MLKFVVYLDWDSTSTLFPVTDKEHARRVLAEHVDDDATGFYIELDPATGFRWAEHIHADPEEGDQT